MRVLLLGGTTEAGEIAAGLAAAGIDAVYSYAGRTGQPRPQPIPQRLGGFGGAAGLAQALRDGGFTHLVDATHPFAARISAHALDAARATGTPCLACERPAWQPGPGDRWQAVPDLPAAVAALPVAPARVFLAIGRQHVALFAAAPQHQYLLRFVDDPGAGDLPLPDARLIVARGPFDAQAERALLAAQGITHLVAKNAGGSGGAAKLAAARDLGLPVILVDRPAMPARPVVDSPARVLDWLHAAPPPDAAAGAVSDAAPDAASGATPRGV